MYYYKENFSRKFFVYKNNEKDIAQKKSEKFLFCESAVKLCTFFFFEISRKRNILVPRIQYYGNRKIGEIQFKSQQIANKKKKMIASKFIFLEFHQRFSNFYIKN